MRIRDAVIVDAVRTPVGKRGGVLSSWHPADLLGHTLRNLLVRTGIDPSRVDDVIAGCAMQHENQSGNIGRHAVLSAGFPESVPAVTIDRQCGSGLQTVNFAAHGIVAGSYEIAIACGVESMSQTPLPPALKPGALLGPQYAPLELQRYNGRLLAQGLSSELLNRKFGFRRDDLDAYSARSHERAWAATCAGAFRGQMVPVTTNPYDNSATTIDIDEGIREHVDRAKMATLPTVFDPDGCTTAANSSQLSDGAAALLIVSSETARHLNLKPRARFHALSVAADDPIIQFTAVIESTRKALKVAELGIEDIDLVEVNEAFAGVPLMVQQEFAIPDERLNVNGGSIAIGHPLGSTGARMLTDLLCELERREKRYGLVTVCEATGTANTTIIERI
ncbi:thiolase family protein [Rhodococcus qingshengii]|uniref:thiolase family protein n=1 Tax=Rhodococcus qingshengii TaxID=334542 RepID=UPI001C23EB1F|nr:thiolase family protein [Rhodococcus qingshengii]QXC46864.1 thiolase family protein [Rhodococcus qingshengii]